MATQVVRTDDLTGEAGAQEVSFSLNGKSYTLDLTDKSLKALEKLLAPYVKAATPVKAQRASRGSGKASERSYDPAQVREWQAATGRAVTMRGRFPQADLDAYAKK